jgi:hypothetical protein
MKMIDVLPLSNIRFMEFPDLIFYETKEGGVYFDATHYLEKADNNRNYSVKDFDIAFTFWKSAISNAYDLQFSELVVLNSGSGHVMMDQALSLLFIAYLDSSFAIHILERMEEMLINGVVLSDSALLLMTQERLTQEDITKITGNNEKE